MKRLFIIAAIAAVALAGCKKDEKETPPEEIKVENETTLMQTVYADQTDGKSGVTITTAGAWTSSVTAGTATKAETINWASISPSSGAAAGTYSIVISLEPNTTG